MNKAMLMSKLVANGDTQAALADYLGISLSCLNAKINEKADFRRRDIAMIRHRYNLSANEIDEIFFAEKVS
jgi:hypothetical protein